MWSQLYSGTFQGRCFWISESASLRTIRVHSSGLFNNLAVGKKKILTFWCVPITSKLHLKDCRRLLDLMTGNIALFHNIQKLFVKYTQKLRVLWLREGGTHCTPTCISHGRPEIKMHKILIPKQWKANVATSFLFPSLVLWLSATPLLSNGGGE